MSVQNVEDWLRVMREAKERIGDEGLEHPGPEQGVRDMQRIYDRLSAVLWDACPDASVGVDEVAATNAALMRLGAVLTHASTAALVSHTKTSDLLSMVMAMQKVTGDEVGAALLRVGDPWGEVPPPPDGPTA